MRILVCGGRDYGNPADPKDPIRIAIFRFLDEFTVDPDCDYGMPKSGTVVAHGDCKTGVDACADDWCVVNWVPVKAYPADWSKHGRAGGPIRNQHMLDDFKPNVVIAFPGNNGTEDMVRRASRRGVPVIRVPKH